MSAARTHYPLNGPTRRRVRLARVLLTTAARNQRPVTVAFTTIRSRHCHVHTLEVFEIITTAKGYTVVTGMDYYSPTRGEGCVTRVRAERIRWIRLHLPGYRLEHPWPPNLML